MTARVPGGFDMFVPSDEALPLESVGCGCRGVLGGCGPFWSICPAPGLANLPASKQPKAKLVNAHLIQFDQDGDCKFSDYFETTC